MRVLILTRPPRQEMSPYRIDAPLVEATAVLHLRNDTRRCANDIRSSHPWLYSGISN